MLEDVAHRCARGDPYLAQVLGIARVVDLLRWSAAHRRQGAVQCSDDIGDRHLRWRHRQAEPSVGTALTRHDACVTQASQDVLEELERDLLRLRDALALSKNTVSVRLLEAMHRAGVGKLIGTRTWGGLVGRAGAPQLIADNACANLFVLGPRANDWRGFDYINEEIKVSLNGQPVDSGFGRNVLGDPREGLTWLVNELSSIGIACEQDQIVTTGTCRVPVTVKAGDRVEADFGVLGKVACSFS